MGTAESALQVGEMIVYEAGHDVDQCDLADLGDPAALGGTVLTGHPAISARVDYDSNGVMAGVFQATRGKILIHFPFTEHATVLVGEVTLSDQYGHSHTFKPGDSYLIKQGSDILWDVKGPRVQKSFFNRVEAADAPGPMTVYQKGEIVSGMIDLGAPVNLGGTVLSGNPVLSGRIDYASGPMMAGEFQATKGTVAIDFPFTEHATVTHDEVTLTDEHGTTRKLHAGDSYLILEGSHILWDVKSPRVQKSFCNVAAP